MVDREHTLSIRLNATELAQVHHLAEVDDVSIGQAVRRWIRETYAARFGEAAPPTVKLRPGPRRRTRAK